MDNKMSFDPKLKSLSVLKEAVLKGELSPKDFSVELKVRLNRSSITKNKKKRTNEALIWINELNNPSKLTKKKNSVSVLVGVRNYLPIIETENKEKHLINVNQDILDSDFEDL